MHLEWILDFHQSIIRGIVQYEISPLSEESSTLTLDTKDLIIETVAVGRRGIEKNGRMPVVAADEVLSWTLLSSEAHPTMGTPLVVTIPSRGKQWITIEYATTSNGASALQWMSPEQTTSKRFPFLFSQCQAIHARSMLPCQDLCQVKTPYTARVIFPDALCGLMSAVRKSVVPIEAPVVVDGQPECFSGLGWSCATFEQRVPIPAYLIAVVCGELEGHMISPRCTVWAEPDVVGRAASEFSETEAMIAAAEDRLGTLRFDCFDLLVLPFSFPYGGMENPCLTFVTPTLLAGDKSQVAVIVHELCHSWSGNLVTNATWDHFWINEGLTVFNETKLIATLFGEETSSLRKAGGWQDIRDDVQRIGCCHRFTCLCPKLERGEDPDDAFSSVPYEKGAALFWAVENVIGEEAMKELIRLFFNTFAFKTVSSASLREFFVSNHAELGESIPWESWFHEPGLPAYQPPFLSAPIEEATLLAKEWMRKADSVIAAEEVASRTSAPFVTWPSAKRCVFLNHLAETAKDPHASRLVPWMAPVDGGAPTLPTYPTPLHDSVLLTMNSHYHLLQSNCEIRCAFIVLWLTVSFSFPCLHPELTKAVRQMVGEQGRMKFVRPLFRAWLKVDARGAKDAFAQLKGGYHPIARKMLERDVNPYATLSPPSHISQEHMSQEN
eukprot:CAMPEP_0176449730 /NCGR_PEP_ID=MMETSP0127-20121128/26665_1 /TAXON_ID=938130 /ORGANISM="Platyophrya macrostoma, Strain WH" /LENGTH=666 /DNA_ID=CAMNT_0017837151 /DNA_START=131 /DNA_END=2129 /DNA_ORIENTATION=+